MREIRFCALLLIGVFAYASAQQTLTGRLPAASGIYTIEAPAGWRAGGRLLVYNHGFSMDRPDADDPPETAPDATTRQYFLNRGYALAAGSYSTRGWALFDLVREQHALYDEFTRRLGRPGEVIAFGGSLGGLVSVRTAEDFTASGVPVAGVFALCPPLAGARTWDQALDARLLFDAVCTEHPLPTGSSSLPWTLDYSEIPEQLGDLQTADTLTDLLPLANRVRQCMGFFQPALLDTTAQLARRAQFKQLLGISSDDFLLYQLSYATFALSDLVQAPEKLAGSNAFDNRFVDYGDPAINARILRIRQDPIAATQLRVASDIGRVAATTRLLAITTSRDELVVPEHLSALPAASTVARALVREDSPSHCGFTRAEVLGGFEALRAWIDGGGRPDPTALNARCASLRGSSNERCAFESAETLRPFDQRTRPRGLDIAPVTASHTGVWSDPAFDGEGLLIEVLAGGRQAIVGWYTYPPAGASGEQTWIAGLGEISADGIHVQDAARYRGPGFGITFDPSRLATEPFGSLTLAFDGCGTPPRSDGNGVGRMRYRGGTGFGSGERALVQLSHNGTLPQHCRVFGPPPTPARLSEFSGTWYRGPNANGDGVVFQVQPDGFALLAWYTFDPQGNAAWLLGTGQVGITGGTTVAFQVLRPRGTRFGVNFNAAAVQRLPWGSAQLRFVDCGRAQLSWQTTEPGWVSGAIDLLRLTTPAGVACQQMGGGG